MRYLCLAIVLMMVSCEISEIFTKPTAREIYSNTLSDTDLIIWKDSAENSFRDSVIVNLPYSEQLSFDSTEHYAIGYHLELEQGERLNLSINSTNVLLDVFQKTTDSLEPYKPFLQPSYLAETYKIEIAKTSTYFVRLQTKFATYDTAFFSLHTEPIYAFPVSGGNNRDIGSVWGDPRDGGKRLHKGIDIFARKGTPLVAVTDGTIRSVRNRGLGGKQIWLYDDERNFNIYYAHLDSQYVNSGQRVNRGDTIGTVGNTGNAKSTPPHLHYGMYASRKGAFNPMTYVRIQQAINSLNENDFLKIHTTILAKNSNSPFRLGPSSKSPVIRMSIRSEKFNVIGSTGGWYHVQDQNLVTGFIYKNSVIPDLPS